MSDALITRRGGGGKLFAVIGVIYPAGSICTCTNGQKTLKARDTSGNALFVVPEAGTWTVKAVLGDKSKSNSVSITTQGQMEVVELTFELVLFDNGSYAAETGGWSSVKNNKLYAHAAAGVGNRNSGYSGTNKPVDLSKYKTLHFEGIGGSSLSPKGVIGTASWKEDIASADIGSSISLENVNGSYFIGIMCRNRYSVDDSLDGTLTVSKVWAE